MAFYVFFALLALCCTAQPASQSPTPTTSITPAITPTPSKTPVPVPVLCPSSVCSQYAFTPQPSWQLWQVPVAADYSFIYVALWGAGGYDDESYLGGAAAFAAGAVAVIPGESLRVIVGSSTSASETGGCGGASSNRGPADYRGVGGGRSAIQRMFNGTFKDIISVGGGGGAGFEPGGNGGAASSDYAAAGNLGGKSTINGVCVIGQQQCGGSPGQFGIGSGGGGWCGGLASDGGGWLGGGGGSSYYGINRSMLLCPYLADTLIGNFLYTPFPSNGAGQHSADGLILISQLPRWWQPCTIISPSTSLSPTPSPIPSASSSTFSASSTASTTLIICVACATAAVLLLCALFLCRYHHFGRVTSLHAVELQQPLICGPSDDTPVLLFAATSGEE